MVALVLALTGVFTLAIWRYAENQEAERIHNGFLSRAQTQISIARQSLRDYEEMIYSLRDCFIGQQHVSRAEFAQVAQSLLSRHRGVQALQWVRIVPREERATLEQQASAELGRPFVIRRRLPDNSLQPAPADDEYFVITYVEPLAGNEAVLGYDVSSAPSAALLRAARADRQFRVSQTFHLVQSGSDQSQPGVVFILPFWHTEKADGPVEGFVQGVFLVQSMLAESHALTTNEALDTYYFDITEGAAPTLLYVNLAGYEPMRTPGTRIDPPSLNDPDDYRETLQVGGRKWLMLIRPNPDWMGSVRTEQPRLVLAAGLTITILLTLFVHSLLRRTASIEAEVAARTRELHASEARLQAILDHSPAIIFVKDLEGRYILFNQPFIDNCPARAHPLHGRTDLELFPGAEAALYREHDRQVLASGQPQQFETTSLHPDGRVVTSIVQKFPLLDDEGRPYALCGIVTDISERKAAEEQRLMLERKLLEAQKLESLGVLAGGIAHDFNNILTAILGNASLASLDLPASHPARPQLQQIEHAARRASDLCAQMLAYAGKAALATAPVSLSALVRDTAALLKVSVGKRCRLELQTDDTAPAVMGDATQLRQIVMNLVLNAADAVGDRTGALITVRTFAAELTAADFARAVQAPALPAGRYVGLEVRDNGTGMSPETLSRIFEPFFTTKFSGRGLGLSACLGIVQRHGGALFVESTPGQGSVFRLFFPPTTAAARPGSAPPLAPEPASTLHGTILVVDDEESVRHVACQTLAVLGLRTLTAADGTAAIGLFREHAPEIDLVLLDLTMPGLSGEETLRELHAIRPDLRVILMSGYNAREMMARCTGPGVLDFLPKPFDVSSLSQLLNRHLG
jgi:PAS domain S-box-containing protein